MVDYPAHKPEGTHVHITALVSKGGFFSGEYSIATSIFKSILDIR